MARKCARIKEVIPKRINKEHFLFLLDKEKN